MPSSFPGMDPYLEDKEHWRGFHHHLSEEIARQLNPLITPKYYADVEVHTPLENVQIGELHHSFPNAVVMQMRPDEPMRAATVAIPEAPVQVMLDLSGGFKTRTVHVYETERKRLVTSIEILSPANKTGEGFEKYRKKRLQLLHSDVHLIEIDLLRSGRRPGTEFEDKPQDADYILLVNRASADAIRISAIWPLDLKDRLPTLPVPLLDGDADIPLQMAEVFTAIYETYFYSLRIDYSQPIPPPIVRPSMRKWLDAQL